MNETTDSLSNAPGEYIPLSKSGLKEVISSHEVKTVGTVLSPSELKSYLESEDTPRQQKNTIQTVLEHLKRIAVMPVPGGEEEIYTSGVYTLSKDTMLVSAVRTTILTQLNDRGMVTEEADYAHNPRHSKNRLILENGHRQYKSLEKLPLPLVRQWIESEPEVNFYEGGGHKSIRRVMQNAYGATVIEVTTYDTNGNLTDIKFHYHQRDRGPDLQ